MASEFLSRNGSNRRVNQKQLDMLVREIESGNWRLTHQGVAFYDDGQLADGQHRLCAIMKSGVTLKMPVFTGIKKDDETILAIDCGKGRTVADSTSISGVKLSAGDVSIAKGIEFGYGYRAFKRLTHIESRDLCEKHSEKLSNIRYLFPKSKPFITFAPIKVAAANAVSDGVAIELAKKFCDALVTGEYTESIFVNAVRLRAKLIGNNYNAGVDRLTAYNMMYNTIIRTARGEEVKRILECKLLK